MRHLLVTMFVLAAGPALAQDRPPLLPSKDVTVTYATSQGREMTITYGGGGQRMRIEGMSAGGGYAIVDRTAGTMTIVRPQQQMYMRMPEPPAMRAGMLGRQLDNATFAREGRDSVAGIACTVWKVTTEKGTGDACVDANGLVLRARGANSTDPQHQDQLLLAKKVDYHRVPASIFEPPADYKAMTLPAMPGATPPGAKP
jgi:Domain of unknown function (DUF4412)